MRYSSTMNGPGLAGIPDIYKGCSGTRKMGIAILGFFDINWMENIYWFFTEYHPNGTVTCSGAGTGIAGVRSR
jgi:hypothetical protein